jgi:hypothetical protein
MNINYYDLMECDLPVSFREIISNPIGLIFYIFCLWVLMSWIVYTFEYFKTAQIR